MPDQIRSRPAEVPEPRRALAARLAAIARSAHRRHGDAGADRGAREHPGRARRLRLQLRDRIRRRGLVRDLLPLDYDAIKEAQDAAELRRYAPLTSEQAIEQAHRMVAGRAVLSGGCMDGRCNPQPTLPPPSPTAALVGEALERARLWERHPLYAIDSTRHAARAYATASQANVPGARDAVKRLAGKLAAIGGTQRCGL
jgi:hypothetical protein